VVEAARPAVRRSGVEVALAFTPKLDVGVQSNEFASVPQERIPAVEAFTSQEALLRLETVSADVEALPVTARLVVVAALPVAFTKVKFWSVEEPVRRMFPKVWRLVHVLTSVRSEEEAAVIVMESPRLKVVLLMVPREPLTSVERIEVVA
jgi:hypothetical protein